MKRLFLPVICILTLSSAWGQSVVRITQLSVVDGAAPALVFHAGWTTASTQPNNRDTVWLFADVRTVNPDGTSGSWTPARITGATITAGNGSIISGTLPGRGFFLDGHGFDPLDATITVTLAAPLNTPFNACVYASDYPPNATEGAGHYVLHGTPPFVVNGTDTVSNTQYAGCIDALTDATGCPGLIPAKPVVAAFTASPDAVCIGDTVTLAATVDGATEYRFDGGAWTTAPSIAVTPPANSTYTLQVRNAAGCTVTATPVAVTVVPLPTAAFSAAPTTACAGETVTFTATGGSLYCFTHSCSACRQNPYAAGNDDPVDAACLLESDSCEYTSSNSYPVVMPDSGSVTVWVRVRNAAGCTDSVSTTVTLL
ncbi:MAG: hypothetical protein LBF90_07180, partial [Prevotellaceae bacterium]|nr:hypothetical protein [Prevotellaceae bacterium]